MIRNIDTAEPVGSSWKASDLYSVGTRFESWPRYQLSALRKCVLFVSPSRQLLRYFKIGHDCYLPNSFSFTERGHSRVSFDAK
jgi:hypothetical protein